MSGNSDELGERRRALEESFFADKGKPSFQRKMPTQERKQALAEASGISDDVTLDHLLTAGFSDKSITALGLVPLLATAWADGSLDDGERRAILSACELEGITPTSVGYQLLEGWLLANPGDALLVAWKDFISVARKHLSPEALEALQGDLIGRARSVAQASSGLLGVEGISAAETQMLRKLELAFR